MIIKTLIFYIGKAEHHRHDILNKTLELLKDYFVQDPDFEWLMTDASHMKVHAHGTGAAGGNQDMGLTKGGSARRFIWQ